MCLQIRTNAEPRTGYGAGGKSPESLEWLTLHTTGPCPSAGQAHKGAMMIFNATIMAQQLVGGDDPLFGSKKRIRAPLPL